MLEASALPPGGSSHARDRLTGDHADRRLRKRRLPRSDNGIDAGGIDLGAAVSRMSARSLPAFCRTIFRN
jgi:hypothetical protein